jgi:hypothetical protein
VDVWLEVGRLRGFPNLGCAILEFWKTGCEGWSRDLCFPRLPQGRAKGLCKADCLCEKRVQGAMKSGLAEMPFSTEGED